MCFLLRKFSGPGIRSLRSSRVNEGNSSLVILAAVRVYQYTVCMLRKPKAHNKQTLNAMRLKDLQGVHLPSLSPLSTKIGRVQTWLLFFDCQRLFYMQPYGKRQKADAFLKSGRLLKTSKKAQLPTPFWVQFSQLFRKALGDVKRLFDSWPIRTSRVGTSVPSLVTFYLSYRCPQNWQRWTRYLLKHLLLPCRITLNYTTWVTKDTQIYG